MQQMENKNDMIVVNRSMLIGNIFHLLFLWVFGALYVCSYVAMPSIYKNEHISKWFLAYIVTNLAGSGVQIFNIWTIMKNLGSSISHGVWERLQTIEQFPFNLLKYTGIVEIITGCYIATKYVPFADCPVYEDAVNTDLTCTSMRIISVISIVKLSLVVLILFIVSSCRGCYCFASVRGTNPNFTINGTNVLSKKYLLTNYLVPIPVPNNSEEICSICSTSVEEDIQANRSTTWSTLSCDHKFHADCITEWLGYHQTCPLCRKDAVVINGSAISV